MSSETFTGGIPLAESEKQSIQIISSDNQEEENKLPIQSENVPVETTTEEPVTFTDVLPILNESIIPNLPWGLPPKCWLFDKPTETLFLNPGTYNINKESIIGEVIPLDAVDAEIANRLQLGTHWDKLIMDLYLNI